MKIIKENFCNSSKSSLFFSLSGARDETLNTNFPAEARRKFKTPLALNAEGFLFLPDLVAR